MFRKTEGIRRKTSLRKSCKAFFLKNKTEQKSTRTKKVYSLRSLTEKSVFTRFSDIKSATHLNHKNFFGGNVLLRSLI